MHQGAQRLRASRRTRAVAALVALASVAGCASGGGGGAEAGAGGADPGGEKCGYGCMVPGARIATALGISAVDTLPELPARATLRATVKNAIDQHVLQNQWSTNNNCLRKFGSPEFYVVVFHRYCDSAMGSDSDPRMVVGFTSTGQVRGEVTWVGPTTVGLLIPQRRY